MSIDSLFHLIPVLQDESPINRESATVFVTEADGNAFSFNRNDTITITLGHDDEGPITRTLSISETFARLREHKLAFTSRPDSPTDFESADAKTARVILSFNEEELRALHQGFTGNVDTYFANQSYPYLVAAHTYLTEQKQKTTQVF